MKGRKKVEEPSILGVSDVVQLAKEIVRVRDCEWEGPGRMCWGEGQ